MAGFGMNFSSEHGMCVGKKEDETGKGGHSSDQVGLHGHGWWLFPPGYTGLLKRSLQGSDVVCLVTVQGWTEGRRVQGYRRAVGSKEAVNLVQKCRPEPGMSTKITKKEVSSSLGDELILSD